MRHIRPALPSIVGGIIAAVCVLTAGVPVAAGAELPLIVRGSKSVQILPDAAGPMTITISKREMRIYPEPAEMTVTVSDPWQRQVATTVIPALDRAEPVETQIVQLQIEVEEPGLHRVDVSVGGHGDVLWGIEISSGRYLVVGEVFVNDASIGGDIYFSAPDGAFALSATTPHDAGIQQIWVYDALGEAIGAIDLVERGETVELEVPAGAGDRSGPWRLRLEAMNARVFSSALKYWATESTMIFDPADVKRYIAPSAKNEQTFYTPERIATAHENLERYGWAQDLLELIMEGQPYSYLVGRDYVRRPTAPRRAMSSFGSCSRRHRFRGSSRMRRSPNVQSAVSRYATCMRGSPIASIR